MLQNCEEQLSASSGLSVRKVELGSHWTDFHKISYLRVFGKSVVKVHVSLKSSRNNGYFTRSRMHIYDDISLNFSYNEKSFRKKNCRENQNTRFIFKKFFFENRAVYEIMWKNMLEPDRSQMTV